MDNRTGLEFVRTKVWRIRDWLESSVRCLARRSAITSTNLDAGWNCAQRLPIYAEPTPLHCARGIGVCGVLKRGLNLSVWLISAWTRRREGHQVDPGDLKSPLRDNESENFSFALVDWSGEG